MISALTNLRDPTTIAEKGVHIAYDARHGSFCLIDLTQIFQYYSRSVFFALNEHGYREIINFENYEETNTIRTNDSFVLFFRANLSEENKATLDALYKKIFKASTLDISIHTATTKEWLRLGNTREKEGLLY